MLNCQNKVVKVSKQNYRILKSSRWQYDELSNPQTVRLPSCQNCRIVRSNVSFTRIIWNVGMSNCQNKAVKLSKSRIVKPPNCQNVQLKIQFLFINLLQCIIRFHFQRYIRMPRGFSHQAYRSIRFLRWIQFKYTRRHLQQIFMLHLKFDSDWCVQFIAAKNKIKWKTQKFPSTDCHYHNRFNINKFFPILFSNYRNAMLNKADSLTITVMSCVDNNKPDSLASFTTILSTGTE